LEDEIHRADVIRLVDINFPEFEPRFAIQVADVASAAGKQVVHANDMMSVRKKRIAQMGADESGAAGYQYTHKTVLCSQSSGLAGSRGIN
jgi:hypothetical protein